MDPRSRGPVRALPPLLLPLVLAPATAAGATAPPDSTADAYGEAFDLHLAVEDVGVDYADGTRGGDLELGRLGITFSERLGSGLWGSIGGGAVGVRQAERPATDGIDPSGWFAGLDFAALWPAQGRLRFNGAARWRFVRADDADQGEQTELDWQRAELEGALVLRTSPRTRLRVGVTHLWLDGDESFDAAPTSTGFDVDEPWSGFIGLDLFTDAQRAIRLRARGGNPSGARVAFEYRF